MSSDVNHTIGVQYLRYVRIESHEAVMRSAATRHHQTHRVTFIAKGGLNPDEDVAERQPLNQEMIAKRIDCSRSSTPIALNLVHIWTELAILRRTHPISDIRRSTKSFAVAVEQQFTQVVCTTW